MRQLWQLRCTNLSKYLKATRNSDSLLEILLCDNFVGEITSRLTTTIIKTILDRIITEPDNVIL